MKKIRFSLLLAFFTCLLSNAQQADTTICINPEVNPSFQYDTCSITRESLKKYFNDNFKFPAELLDMCLTGSVYSMLTIEKDGRISNVELLIGIIPSLDNAVIESIKQMPPWKPAIDKGKTVKTFFSIPISINWLY